jgi:hypothetical protein
MVFFLTSSCKPDNDKNSTNTGFSQEKNVKTEQVQARFYHRFPSAKEMLQYIKTDHLNYKENLVNPVQNLDRYHDTRAKTLNLGVYLTDLSYMILFDKTQGADQYFNAIFQLTSELRIKIPEEEHLFQRISDNMYNTDSLIQIADQYQSLIINHLLNTGKERTLAVISTGSYIEGLYISSKLVTDYKENKITVDKIAEQKYAFKNLANFAETFREDMNTRYSMEYLNEINSIFNELPVIEKKTKVKRTDEHTLLIEGGEKTTISRQQFESLKEKISEIRAEIVNNKVTP